MEREDVKKLLMTLDVTYANFKLDPATLSFTVDSWLMFLGDYDSKDVLTALKTFINTSNSAFAPSPSELIGLIHKPSEMAEIGASEAWALVRKAIGKSAYNSQSEFEKLPPLVQKTLGSAEQLHLWAVDEDYNNEVVMALFQKNYNATVERQQTEYRLPTEARLRLEQIRKDAMIKLDSNAFLLGQKADKLQEGDFDYEDRQRPDNETLGHYAEKIREKLGVE